ncbi:transcriptional regulator [Flavobacteriales bacterium 33_180_T64]|nr:transcriptional regulator [Flavobacteriales bacterium 33_180_T64]
MRRKQLYVFGGIVILVILTWMLSCTAETHSLTSGRVKIALREAGHQLLMKNQDSTSLILPIIQLNESNYELSFNSTLSFQPGDLVAAITQSLEKAQLSVNYRVEVLQCKDNEVAYSYEIRRNKENTIIPCSVRTLPVQCYTIHLQFLDMDVSRSKTNNWLYILIFAVIIFLLVYVMRKPKSTDATPFQNDDYSEIGSFQFYPEQNKLVKAATEISLSKKECELLEIFVAHPNQIIKRDELTKKVWEDNGVIVGRSLDTYISKLRKKLKDDETIKLTNVHGVGYKLEIN